MKYAVFASGGKQYKVSEGDTVELEKLKTEPGAELTFDSVLFYAADGAMEIGKPTLQGVTITAKVLDQIKARKIRVAKFKAKARYRKVYGHRQQLTKVQILKIGAKQAKAAKEEAPKKVKSTSKKVKSE